MFVLLPAQTAVFEGWFEMEGASFTVKVAALDVTGGVQVPESTHLYIYPFIDELADRIVSVEVVTPE